jgi:hypothetical protein
MMQANNRFLQVSAVFAVGWLAAILPNLAWPADNAERVPLELNLPAPTLKGTPDDLPVGVHIEPLSDAPNPPFLAPKGVRNLALGRNVVSNIAPFTGKLEQITDGRKEPLDEDAVEFKKGSLWVQIDLGSPAVLYAIACWHDHRYVQAMHDVIFQVCDDADFKTNVTTVFNNDLDNSSECGPGKDREYFETAKGKIVDAKGIRGRYVRGYQRGSSTGALNCWQELEIYGLLEKSPR